MKKTEEHPQDNEKNTMTWMPIGMCIGISIGMAIGSLMGNISIGMSMGVSIGMAVGILIDRSQRTSDSSVVNDETS